MPILRVYINNNLHQGGTMSPKNKYLIDVKNRILKSILLTSVGAFFIVGLVNFVNSRPLTNILMPLSSAAIVSVLYYLVAKNKWVQPIRLAFLFFLSFLYYPSAWLTSPGSYSAMPFYAIVILFVTLILIHRWWEYVFPLSILISTILLLNYETTKPLQYHLYLPPQIRAIDLSVNFLVASGIVFLVIIILNSYFESEHHRIFETSVTDALTGLYNRRYLYQYLEDLYMTREKESIKFSILMMDLDHFKKVNDNYGHLAGDDVLKAFGAAVKASSRKVDVPVRYGGDEFALILDHTQASDALLVQNRIMEIFQPVCKHYEDVGLNVSFGICESHGDDFSEIIKTADDYLYKNKKSH